MNKSVNLLKEIMKDGLKDVDVIKNKWYGDKMSMWQELIMKIKRLHLITILGLLLIIGAGFIFWFNGCKINDWCEVGKLLITISLGFIAIGISFSSDKKMKSLCTAFFMDISFMFEQNKNKIKSDVSPKIRDYLIWQNRRLVLRAVQLKDWVDTEFQEDLVKYFVSGKHSMIKGLRAKNNLKLSDDERTNIRCMYDDFKKLNLKDKDIERPSDLIDDEK